MAKRMLIDASQPEETRVVVLSGNALEDFDFEATAKKSLKGNIYLAKVVRVEPSLQAAFVDFGSSRHGFLSFNEIHPDYYRIPVADREALIAEEARIASDAEAETSSKSSSNVAGKTSRKSKSPTKDDSAETNDGKESKSAEESTGEAAALNGGVKVETVAEAPASGADKKEKEKEEAEGSAADTNDNDVAAPDSENDKDEEFTDLETVGGDTDEDMAPKREPVTRRYKIQEVIKRGQILLVQVAKEERGTKGAALTTRISLAGRYCVLMPNVARGGGISRKIANPTDRRKLKAILDGLSIPEGVAVIVRTAGRERTKAEIKRDYEYLMRLWSDIRDATLQSSAPSLVYEEANIIKRAIRDLYSRDMDEVLVDSEDGYRLAKESMRMLTPSHAKRVKRYRDGDIPLFSRFEVDDQIDAIHNHSVRLKSGGYIVIDQTEALVSIDVNSGRSTRERNIEETALKTNLEAADEVARQLRLRDLAGLIVIDFIDMDEYRNRSKVEKRIKEALKTDRARIQIGRISGFGLLEMSRQRLRPSLHEISTQTCPHCSGRGVVRSIESTALHVLRAIEKEGSHNRNGQLSIHVPSEVDLYILNQKRDLLSAIEARHSLRVMIHHDASLVPPDFHIEGGAGGKAADDKTGKKEDKKEEKKSKSSSLRRRGRSRAKDAEEPADEDSRETSPVVDEPGDGDREDKPPRKRRRRGKRGGRRHSRKSAAKKTTAESTEMDSESKVSSATTEKAAKEESEKPATKPRKKATRRTRKPAKSVAEKKAASSSGKDGDSKTPVKKKSTAATPAAASDSDGSSAAKPAADNKPKRRGWWNALMD